MRRSQTIVSQSKNLLHAFVCNEIAWIEHDRSHGKCSAYATFRSRGNSSRLLVLFSFFLSFCFVAFFAKETVRWAFSGPHWLGFWQTVWTVHCPLLSLCNEIWMHACVAAILYSCFDHMLLQCGKHWSTFGEWQLQTNSEWNLLICLAEDKCRLKMKCVCVAINVYFAFANWEFVIEYWPLDFRSVGFLYSVHILCFNWVDWARRDPCDLKTNLLQSMARLPSTIVRRAEKFDSMHRTTTTSITMALKEVTLFHHHNY